MESTGNELLTLPSIEVTAFGVAPYRVNLQEFMINVVQDEDMGLKYARDLLEMKEIDNGQEEHFAYQEYTVYDQRALEAQINNDREDEQ